MPLDKNEGCVKGQLILAGAKHRLGLPMKAKRAGLYVRVSTEEQRTDLQEHHLKEYVSRRGWKLHKIYRDKMSGASASRPGLE